MIQKTGYKTDVQTPRSIVSNIRSFRKTKKVVEMTNS